MPALFDPELLKLHGFGEPGPEDPIRALLKAAAAFCGAPAVLVLRDGGGVWFLASEGLEEGEDEGLDVLLAPACAAADGVWGPFCTFGLLVPGGGSHGCLAIRLAPGALLPIQRVGLMQLVAQVGALVSRRLERGERRAVSRGSTGATFVPGLVHELRNFSFGISGSLDAFEARFQGQPDTEKYGRVMRQSLDRLGAFLAELREYGDPGAMKWEELDLETILHEGVEHHRAAAGRLGVEVRLACAGPLPRLQADAQSLRTAFVRLLELALQQEDPGGSILLRADVRLQGARRLVFGHLDTSGNKLAHVDLARLFEPFYYRASGLGRLALPTARRIFESHGGNLAAGPGPSGGMRMGFMLPEAPTLP